MLSVMEHSQRMKDPAWRSQIPSLWEKVRMLAPRVGRTAIGDVGAQGNIGHCHETSKIIIKCF